MSTSALRPRSLTAASRAAIARLRTRRAGQSFLVTLIAVVVVAAFLSPMLRSISISLKDSAQLSQLGSPLYPADPVTYDYQGHSYDVYEVPLPDGTTRELALVVKGRTTSQFVDPANPDAGLITWDGSWRALSNAWVFAPHFENFGNVWDLINYPRLLFNTIAIALIGMVGVLTSCILVAYGFARYRFPGRNFLFILLIATIFLPTLVTLIPTYTIWVKLGVVGSPNGYLAWAPLLVPAFFANAYDVFLLRQYFLTIPREMDEAAAMDGAGPLRTLVSVILPQSWAAVIAVGIFHFVYSWNNYLEPSIYLSTRPDLQPIAVGLAAFNGIHSKQPALIQAGTLMTLVIPVLAFLIFQRFFTRGIVITGVEK
jgi:multiple sugar transport system permease protein